jgi:hypothetical protein
MDRKHECNLLWDMAITYKKGWQLDPSPVVRGDREPLRRAWTSLTKNKPEHQRDELMKVIREAIYKQTLFRKQQKAAGESIPQPVMMSVFINKRRWEREVVLEGEEIKEEKQTHICSHKDCDNEVMGPSFNLCTKHYGLATMQRSGS